MPNAPPSSLIRKLALAASHLPRRCGIATFTRDLSDAPAQLPELDALVLTMSDGGQRSTYPERVREAPALHLVRKGQS